MTTAKIFLIISLIYIAGFFTHALLLHKTVYGDGVFYFSWIHTAAVDSDINVTDEYSHFGVSQPVTPLGFTGNKYSIGPAVLWYPWYVWIHTIVRGTGYEFPYELIIGISSVLYALTGLVLLYKVLLFFFSKENSLLTIAGVAYASNLLFYGSIDTVNSHAVSFLSVCLFLALLFQNERRWFRIGLALGLITLIRPQDIIIGLLVIPYVRKTDIVRLCLGIIYAVLPQLLIWQVLYGKFWISPYISDIEGFNFASPHIIGVLFSPVNGLFLWTPITLIGFAGLWLRHNKAPLKIMACIFLLQLYLISSWSVWWQGASYSGRMFIGTLPLLAFGVASAIAKIESKKLQYDIKLYSIIIPLSVLNAISLVYFLIKQ